MHQWIVTAAMKKLDLNRPEDFDWDVHCVAHALSQINRYTGHTSYPYSVAQHAYLVAEYLLAITNDPVIAMCGLHHDDHEIVIGDISSPVKRFFAEQTSAIKAYELRLESIVAYKFHLPYPYHPMIKEADTRIALNEKAEFFPSLPDKWQIEQEGLLPLPGVIISRMSEQRARTMYAFMHSKLERKIG